MQNQLNDPAAPLPVLTEIIGGAATGQFPLLTEEIGDAGTGMYPLLSEEAGHATSPHPAHTTDTTASPTDNGVAAPAALPDEAASFSTARVEEENPAPAKFIDEEQTSLHLAELASEQESAPIHFSAPAGLMEEESLPDPLVELMDEQEVSPPPAKIIHDAPVSPASEEQVRRLMQQLEVHLETVFISRLNSQLAQLQRLAVDLAVSEFKAELPGLLREALNKADLKR